MAFKKKGINKLREEMVELGFGEKAARAIMSMEAANKVIESLKKAKEADEKIKEAEEKIEEVEEKKVRSIADDSTPKENKNVERRWRSKADKMARHLEKQEKIRILIPLESNEKVGVVHEKMVDGIRRFEHVSGAIWSKTFNGYTVVYPKGTYVDVPMQIADNIRKEMDQTERAGQHLRLDRTDPKTGTTVKQQLS